MIKSVLDFINQKVYKVSQSHATIELSNGKRYNSHTFHQNVSIIRAFILHNVSTNSEMQFMQREMEDRKKALQDRHKVILNTMRKMIDNGMIFATCDYVMPFGKHKGTKLSDIIAKDNQYVQWLMKETDFDFERFMLSSKRFVQLTIDDCGSPCP